MHGRCTGGGPRASKCGTSGGGGGALLLPAEFPRSLGPAIDPGGLFAISHAD